MKVIVPIEWEGVDLLTEQDPNKFGEALRNYCFIGNCQDTGCYTTFNMIDTLKEVKSGKIYEEAKEIIIPENTLHVYHFKIEEKDCYLKFEDSFGKNIKDKFCEPYEIVCAYEWDGDGCLYFRFNDRKVINTDCKCSYYWRWIK